jgi:hypothetical protein
MLDPMPGMFRMRGYIIYGDMQTPPESGADAAKSVFI